MSTHANITGHPAAIPAPRPPATPALIQHDTRDEVELRLANPAAKARAERRSAVRVAIIFVTVAAAMFGSGLLIREIFGVMALFGMVPLILITILVAVVREHQSGRTES